MNDLLDSIKIHVLFLFLFSLFLGSLPWTAVYTLKNPGIKSVMADSDPRDQRLVKPSIDRIGSMNFEWSGDMYDCRIDTRVHSPGREDLVSTMGSRTDSHTVSPDITMEAQVELGVCTLTDGNV